jgi:GTP diphosphokinase / guanosine-3',5'-bis(diphosphate) 3'-diphosphatase
VVEILRSSKQHPSKDWLRIAKTPRALNKIRTWLRTQELEQSITLGREIMEKKLKSLHILKDVDFAQLAHELSFKTPDDLFGSIGFGRTSVNQVVHKIIPEEGKKEQKDFLPKKKQDGSSVVIKGVENLLLRFARCCRPIPGDDIVGYISRGKGIMVHRINCPYVSDIDPQRLIPVEWDATVSEVHEIELSIVCQDKPGMLSSITTIIGAHNINITKLNAYPMVEGTSICVFRVMVKDLHELEKLSADIRKLKGVERIERV